MKQSINFNWKKIPKPVWFFSGLCLTEIAMYCLVYYWRVFFYLDARAFPVKTLTLGAIGFGAVVYTLAWLLSRCKDYPCKAACAMFAIGLLFVFANPPMQTPDEQVHFLRTYAISEGHFDFDLTRPYPSSVSILVDAFPGAWVNAHTSQGMREDENGNEEAYNTAGYALKQYGEEGEVTGVADGFARYFSALSSSINDIEAVQEPLSFAIFPYLPAALGMAVARVFGMQALGCFYGGRIANLLCYALLCFCALKNAKKYKTVLLAVMFLPMSLYMAGSLNYDALLLGMYWYTLSFLCKEGKLTKVDYLGFFAAFVGMNIVKPWISLLFLIVIYLLPNRAWTAENAKKLRLYKIAYGALCVLVALFATAFVTWYGNAFRYNYPEIGRMLGETVNGGEQLVFILANPLRYIAVMLGSLYENDFYLGQLGLFGSLDLPISFINVVSPMVLLLGAVLGATRKTTLRPLPLFSLSALAICYLGGVITALYLTYTPVGMVRVIGVQARYFLPVFGMIGILLSVAFAQILEPRAKESKAVAVGFWTSAAFGLVGGVLLCQHYFIGPVYTI